MQYFKIAVVAVAALVGTSTAGRVHMVDSDVVKDSFEVNKYGRGALVAQPKARAAVADQNTVTVTVTTIPGYCNTATPMIPLAFSTTMAKNSTITTAIKTVLTGASQTGTGTISSATGSAATSSSGSTSSGSMNGASATSSTTLTGTLAGPAQTASALPTSNGADGKRFNGALVAALIVLTVNVIFLI